MEKLYLHPKIHKRLSNVPEITVISNCGTPVEKVSEFLGNQLQLMMRKELPCMKDAHDFINNIRRMNTIPEGYKEIIFFLLQGFPDQYCLF